MTTAEVHGIGNRMMELETGSGWSRGLRNMLRGELNHWFRTRTWWVNILIWFASINLIFLMASLGMRSGSSVQDPSEGLFLFNIFFGLAGPIGVSILMQGALVGEKRSGTASWILSKPISRTAFVVAKLISSLVGIIVTMVVAQGIIAYLIAALVLGVTPPIGGFIAALGAHLVNISFYLTLTLMLGAIFDGIAPVIGIPMAFLFAQNFLNSLAPNIFKFLPYTIAIPLNNTTAPSISAALMTGAPVPTYMPVYSTLAASIIFIIVGIWVFNKQEL